MTPQQYVAVVPVKPPGEGKTRLGDLPDPVRARLAAGFALDTVAACLAASPVVAVVVVTDESAWARAAVELGAVLLPDPGRGLNGALVAGAVLAASRWPQAVPVAVLADLPALRSDDLASCLAGAAGRAAYVADAEGTGTTLYTAPYDEFAPRFGPGSAAAHAATGAVPLDASDAVRRDVDTLADWHAAMAFGVGAHSRNAWPSTT
ncbi:MAG: 2-phospho-L-lactate guanylyltransferase [Nocardioides sp.]